MNKEAVLAALERGDHVRWRRSSYEVYKCSGGWLWVRDLYSNARRALTPEVTHHCYIHTGSVGVG